MMPYLKSISLHTTINRSLAYILNPDKTENLLYTNAVNCLPNAKDSYLAMKTVYEHFSGYNFDEPLPQNGKGRVKAIHYIQLFEPKDNISPELAHKIGKTLVRKVFGDNWQVVIATHIDKGHLHNHIIINTYGIDAGTLLTIINRENLQSMGELDGKIKQLKYELEKSGLEVNAMETKCNLLKSLAGTDSGIFLAYGQALAYSGGKTSRGNV